MSIVDVLWVKVKLICLRLSFSCHWMIHHLDKTVISVTALALRFGNLLALFSLLWLLSLSVTSSLRIISNFRLLLLLLSSPTGILLALINSLFVLVFFDKVVSFDFELF